MTDVKEQINKISEEDMKKIHQVQYLNRILSAGCSPVAPTSVTVVIDDSNGCVCFERMMKGIRQNITWAKYLRRSILQIADPFFDPLTRELITSDDTILIIDDSKPLVMTKYLTDRFCDSEAIYMNIGDVLEGALNRGSVELCFETEPLSTTLDRVPEHIIILTKSSDMKPVTAVNSPELECSVRVIDLRGMGCADVLDSTTVLDDLFEDYTRVGARDDYTIFTDWKPPTYWEFTRSRE